MTVPEAATRNGAQLGKTMSSPESQRIKSKSNQESLLVVGVSIGTWETVSLWSLTDTAPAIDDYGAHSGSAPLAFAVCRKPPTVDPAESGQLGSDSFTLLVGAAFCPPSVFRR